MNKKSLLFFNLYHFYALIPQVDVIDFFYELPVVENKKIILSKQRVKHQTFKKSVHYAQNQSSICTSQRPLLKNKEIKKEQNQFETEEDEQKVEEGEKVQKGQKGQKKTHLKNRIYT